MIKSDASLFVSSIFIASAIITILFSSGFPRAACGSLIESAALGNETDRQALLAFKNALTGDPLGTLRTWNDSVHFCQWAGVACGSRHQRVVMLDFADQQIKGPISPHIGNLSFLRILDLSNNRLEQQIPPEVGCLRRLVWISLANNSIGGEIPVNLTGCSNLRVLQLSGNNLEGIIPAKIGNSLSKLVRLTVSRNYLTGVLPATLANLSSLLRFYASENNIHGSIPSQFGRLKVLKYFIVSDNKLVGTIPVSIFNISSIQYLYLSFNQLRGSLPSQIGGTIFPSLQYLGLAGNLLHGNIPVSISNASNLRYLSLGSNKFTGSIPSMEKLKYLQWISVWNNSLGTGGRVDDLSFLSSLTNITTLEFLYLDRNNFGGELASSIGNFSNSHYGTGNPISLRTLSLAYNRLTGSLPTEIGGLTNLEILRVSHNLLSGEVPNTLASCVKLYKLDMGTNHLRGSLRGELVCNLSKLEILDLSHNYLSGVIPQCMSNFSNALWVMNLGKNAFHGTIPMSFTKASALVSVNLNGNRLEGGIPRSLANCRKMNVLDLGNNRINDTFPHWLEALPELQVLVLRSNKLHGPVGNPETTGEPTFPNLHVFDLSQNDFIGPLPSKYFMHFESMRDVIESGGVVGYGDYKESIVINWKGVITEVESIQVALVIIDLSDNNFEGEVPNVIGNLHALLFLNLSSNRLTGHIPSTLENLRRLESLDLSSNHLSGRIPQQLASLTFLAKFNLSENRLVGPISRGPQFNTFGKDSYGGNLRLCGFPLAKTCSDDQPPPPTPYQEDEDERMFSGFGWRVVLMGYGCGIPVGLAAGFVIFLTGKPKWIVTIVEEKLIRKPKGSGKPVAHRSRRRLRRLPRT